MRQLRTRRVGLAGQRDELLEVAGGPLAVAGGLGGERSTGEAPIAVRILLQGGLEFRQRRGRLPDLEQQLTQ